MELHLTSEQKVEIKNKIEQLMAETNAKIAQLKELVKPVSPDNAIGRLSRMDAINNKSINEAGLRAAQARMTKLERALSCVDLPEFGYCSRCKQTIKLGRILFMPESTKCVHCASRS